MKTIKRGEPGPRSCWHCGRHFLWVAAKDGRVYREVKDPLGNTMRVHQACLPEAVGDGITEVEEDGDG